MQRMTDKLKQLVWALLCEGIDHPYYLFENSLDFTQEEIDFCIEWMKNKLGLKE
jgi:hypothetical protein